MSNEIYIFGASGHAKVVADAILSQKKYSIKGFVVKEIQAATFFNFPVFKESDVFSKIKNAVVAIGDSKIRKEIVQNIKKNHPDISFPNIIHSSALLSDSITLGEGNMILLGASVQADVKIGNHSILNTSCSVDHDCEIKDFCMVAPKACLAGNVYVSEMSFIGMGSNILPNIKIGKNTIVGAGSVVTKDLPENVTAYGNPCKIIS